MRPEPALRDVQDRIYAAFGLPTQPGLSRLGVPNTEVSAYLCCFVAGLIVSRRLLRLLDSATVDEWDAVTLCTFDEELAINARLAGEGFAVLLDQNVPSLPYLQATLGALVEGAHALDGLGTWHDIVNPMPFDDALLDPTLDGLVDPSLEAFGGAYVSDGAFEELTGRSVTV